VKTWQNGWIELLKKMDDHDMESYWMKSSLVGLINITYLYKTKQRKLDRCFCLQKNELSRKFEKDEVMKVHVYRILYKF